MKKCTCCGEIKPLTEFGISRSGFDGHVASCFICQRKRDKVRYVKEREKRLAYRKRTYEESPERYREEVAQYRKTNPHKVAALSMKHRADKFKATPLWVNKKKVEEYYFTASMLGMHTGEQYHVDHIIPLAGKLVCGLHWEGNLQILTATENIRKGNKHYV